jgi:hypothetical protein
MDKKVEYTRLLPCLVVILCLCASVVYLATGNWEGLVILARLGGIVMGSISVLMMLYFIRPRRGAHYAYWNRYLLVFGTLLLGLIGVPFLVGYLSWPIKIFGVIFEKFFGPWVVCFPLAWVLWFKFVFLPSWGLWRLQARYPKMVETARRLKRPGLNYGYAWFMPLIIVQGKPYLLAGYGTRPMLPFMGIATLNAEGRFVTDETLVETMICCYKLAIVVLHSETSLFRAREIERLKGIRRWLRRRFPSLRANEAYFREAGRESYELWQRLAAFEQTADTILATQIERGMWLAGWARDHGLNKLTEISDEQLHEVERRLALFHESLAGCTGQVERVGADAATLQGSLAILADPLTSMNGEQIRLKHRRLLKALLKRLAEFHYEAAWRGPADDFRPLEEDWKAWRLCQELAGESDSREWTGFGGR